MCNIILNLKKNKVNTKIAKKRTKNKYVYNITENYGKTAPLFLS